MRHKHEKPKKSIFAALNAIDWAWLLLAAMLIVVLMCAIISAENKARTPQTDESESVSRASDREIEYTVNVSVPDVVAEIPPRTYIGNCRLTVYTPNETHWGYATATGVRSAHLMTCAVDPKVIPYGSIVIVVDKDGDEWRFKAVDCGNFSGKWVDIFFDGTERHGIEWLDEVFNGDFGEVWIEEANNGTL